MWGGDKKKGRQRAASSLTHYHPLQTLGSQTFTTAHSPEPGELRSSPVGVGWWPLALAPPCLAKAACFRDRALAVLQWEVARPVHTAGPGAAC